MVCLCRCRNIFSIQQCLTNITSNRESDLDHARQYYELLYLPPDVSRRSLLILIILLIILLIVLLIILLIVMLIMLLL